LREPWASMRAVEVRPRDSSIAPDRAGGLADRAHSASAVARRERPPPPTPGCAPPHPPHQPIDPSPGSPPCPGHTRPSCHPVKHGVDWSGPARHRLRSGCPVLKRGIRSSSAGRKPSAASIWEFRRLTAEVTSPSYQRGRGRARSFSERFCQCRRSLRSASSCRHGSSFSCYQFPPPAPPGAAVDQLVSRSSTSITCRTAKYSAPTPPTIQRRRRRFMEEWQLHARPWVRNPERYRRTKDMVTSDTVTGVTSEHALGYLSTPSAVIPFSLRPQHVPHPPRVYQLHRGVPRVDLLLSTRCNTSTDVCWSSRRRVVN